MGIVVLHFRDTLEIVDMDLQTACDQTRAEVSMRAVYSVSLSVRFIDLFYSFSEFCCLIFYHSLIQYPLVLRGDTVLCLLEFHKRDDFLFLCVLHRIDQYVFGL